MDHVRPQVLKTNELLREQIQADTEVYLSSGKQIKIIPAGLSGEQVRLTRVSNQRSKYVDERHSVAEAFKAPNKASNRKRGSAR